MEVTMSNKSHNGRLINPPKGEGKTHNRGPISGKLWLHQGRTYDPNSETFVTEGVLDSLSFVEAGYQAIAVLSAGQDSSKIDFPLQKLTFAIDTNEAGAHAFMKAKKNFEDSDKQIDMIALPAHFGDWNDLLLRRGAEGFKKYIDEERKQLKTEASLLVADTAEEWANIYHSHYQHLPKLIAFNSSYYVGTVKEKSEEVTVTIRRISDFTLTVEYFLQENSLPDRPEIKFQVSISKESARKPVSLRLTAEEITGNTLETTMLKRCNASWSGIKRDNHALVEKITKAKAPFVRQLDAVGKDKESDLYLFPNFAINPKGELIKAGSKGLFKVKNRKYIKPFSMPTIKPEAGLDSIELIHLIRSGWGSNGITALSWFFACWFIDLIKKQLGFFPFLSMYGEPGSGKTSLLTILNAIQCIDHEGIPFNEANTLKGITRKASQFNSIALSFIEVNAPKQKNERKKWMPIADAMLALYNENNLLQLRAQTTQDNQTHDLELNTSFVFSGNFWPFKTRAQKERINSLKFSKEGCTDESRRSYERLRSTPKQQLANLFVTIMQYRERIESEWNSYFKRAHNDLYGLVPDARLTDNHAIVLGSHNLLFDIFGLQPELEEPTKELLQEKYQKCGQRESTLADEFFDTLERLDFFDLDDEPWWAETKGRVLYINIGGAIEWIKNVDKSIRFTSDDLYDPLGDYPAFVHNIGKRMIVKGKSKSLRVWGFDIVRLRDELSSKDDNDEDEVL